MDNNLDRFLLKHHMDKSYSIEQTAKILKHNRGQTKALSDFICSHLKFIHKIARDYGKTLCGHSIAIEDLFQNGILGFIEKIQKGDYNQDRNVKFYSMAVWWIRQNIQKTIANQWAVNLQPTKYKDYCSISMDNDESYKQYADTGKKDSENEYHELFQVAFSRLTEQEKDIVNHFFGVNGYPKQALREIALRYNRSSESIRKSKNIAIRKLRKFYKNEGLELSDFIGKDGLFS